MRRALPCALAVALAALVHVLAGRFVAGHDVVLAVLGSQRGLTVVVVAALLVARLFLFLLAPGWALHVAVTALLARRRPPEGPAAPGAPPGIR